MKKSNWQVAYENWMDKKVESEVSKTKVLNAELDEELNEWLPDEVFNKVYEKIATLEALHEEEGFKAGFNAGIFAATEAIQLISNAKMCKATE